MRYMVQLDGLRAVAILLVLVQHFSPRFGLFGSEGAFPLGFVGVDLFFVLSGYLITRILLIQRAKAGTTPSKVWRFMTRRALRLFPAYYAVLLVAMAFNYHSIRGFWSWMFGYASNFLAVVEGRPTWGFTQFWSLAVEEQFYLVWPWLVLALPERYLRPAFALLFVSGPLSRLICLLAGGSPILMRFATFCLFDLFASGALLAYAQHTGMTPERERWLRVSSWVGLGLASLVIGLRLSGLPVVSTAEFSLVPFSLVASLCHVRLVHTCSLGSAHPLARVLELSPMVFLGKVSYGIYIYHNFVKDLLPHAFGAMGLPFPASFLPSFVLLTAVTVGVAAASWYGFEKAFNDLKDRPGW